MRASIELLATATTTALADAALARVTVPVAGSPPYRQLGVIVKLAIVTISGAGPTGPFVPVSAPEGADVGAMAEPVGVGPLSVAGCRSLPHAPIRTG
jgi:hypothetical protein